MMARTCLRHMTRNSSLLRTCSSHTKENVALFFDLDNVLPAHHVKAKQTAMNLAMSNCQKRGRVVLTRAYSDSDNLSSKLRRAIASSGMGLVEMPKEHVEGTPNHNMQIIVDAMETAISKPLIKHFVFVAGDCTFRPLMLKLRQLGCFTTMMVMSETTGDKPKPCVDEVIM